MLIPQIKTQLKSKENATEISSQLDNMKELSKRATDLHNDLLPLLPEEEDENQKEWFSSIMDYRDEFKHKVETWIQENLQENSIKSQFEINISEQTQNKGGHEDQAPVEKSNDLPAENLALPFPTVQVPQEELHPCNSVSNRSKKSCSHHSVSSASRSSARLKSETTLAILAAKQKILLEKYALEEEELNLRKRKEKFACEAEELKLHKRKEQYFTGERNCRRKG